jgi:type II secretory pathway component PulM
MSWVVATLLLVVAVIYVTRNLMRLLPPPSEAVEAARVKARTEKALHRELSKVRRDKQQLDAIRAMPDQKQRLTALARFVRRNR